MQGFGFLREQFRQQMTNHVIGIELVERGILFDGWRRQAGVGVLLQRCTGGVLLAAQVATHATVKIDTKVE